MAALVRGRLWSFDDRERGFLCGRRPIWCDGGVLGHFRPRLVPFYFVGAVPRPGELLRLAPAGSMHVQRLDLHGMPCTMSRLLLGVPICHVGFKWLLMCKLTLLLMLRRSPQAATAPNSNFYSRRPNHPLLSTS